ncbi:MAG: MGMT family protein [Nitrospira sp.]|nr:MGMT family protein [Nitrospira sp.]
MKQKLLATARRSPLASRLAAVVFRTPWGWMGIAASAGRAGAGICRIVLPHRSRHAVVRALPRPLTPDAASLMPVLEKARGQLMDFLAGNRRGLDFQVDLSQGSTFQRKVWRAALRIPYGRVRSYQWVAAKVGGKHYARAVGLALGTNPVPIVVPCHRVVAADGSLGGFSCGLPAKRRLLALEGTLSQLKS